MFRVKNTHNLISFLKNPLIWIGVVAALLYSSWPLGYYLNPNVTHVAFASQLEASNQPYNWLFICLDVLSGVALIIGGIAQWVRTKSLAIRLSIMGYVTFGVLVIIAALVPFNCDSLNTACYDKAHSPLFIIHGFASIISVVALLASIILIFKLLIDKQTWHWINLVPVLIIASWSLIGILAIHDYHHADENLVQYAFITICGLSLTLAIIFIERLSNHYVNEHSAK